MEIANFSRRLLESCVAFDKFYPKVSILEKAAFNFEETT
jgi:hypothetical protein